MKFKFNKTFLKQMFLRNRRQLEVDLLPSSKRLYFSPVYFGQYQVTLPLLKKHVKGRFIDLGCGDLPFKEQLAPFVSVYDSLDFFPGNSEVTYVSDLQQIDQVADEIYDSAMCLEVLEHIPNPARAINEIFRILKPGGICVVSVPHLSRLHEEPYDFYWFTRYGLQYLFEQQENFKIIHLQNRGGLMSFLGHQLSTVMLVTVWGVPVIRQIIWFLNSWLVTRLCYYIDRWLDFPGVFALGDTVII